MQDQRFDKLTKERHLELARQGGIRSAQVRREKKQMRERINDILQMTLRKGLDQDFNNLEDAENKNLTIADRILLTAIKKAIEGDMQAMTFIRDTSGQKPVDKQEITGGVPVFIKEETLDD